MSDETAAEKPVQVYFNEDGSVSGVHVRIAVTGHFGEPVWLEFDRSSVDLLALYPEDADTVHDDFTRIDAIALPDKPE